MNTVKLNWHALSFDFQESTGPDLRLSSNL